MDILIKIFFAILLVTVLVAAGVLVALLLQDFLEVLDDCKGAFLKRKKSKEQEAAAVKIVTREANVQTLRASRYVDNSIVEKMPPEEVERIVVTCLSEKLAEGIVPFMKVRSEKVQYGNGTTFTAEIKVVDTGSGLGRLMEEEE